MFLVFLLDYFKNKCGYSKNKCKGTGTFHFTPPSHLNISPPFLKKKTYKKCLLTLPYIFSCISQIYFFTLSNATCLTLKITQEAKGYSRWKKITGSDEISN